MLFRAHGPMGPMGYAIPHPYPYPYPGPSPHQGPAGDFFTVRRPTVKTVRIKSSADIGLRCLNGLPCVMTRGNPASWLPRVMMRGNPWIQGANPWIRGDKSLETGPRVMETGPRGLETRDLGVWDLGIPTIKEHVKFNSRVYVLASRAKTKQR